MRLRGFEEQRVGFSWPQLTSWVKILLFYYASVFALEVILYLSSKPTLSQIVGFLGFIPSEVAPAPYFQFYRFFSYLLLPEFDIISFLLNLLSLYFIGGFLESNIGPKRFIALFVFSGIFAALGYFLFSGLQGTATLVGPTSSCLGLLACAAILYPRLEVIFLIFPLPLWAVAGIIALINAFALLKPGSDVAWASLLGLGGGALFAMNLKAITPIWEKLWPKKSLEKWKKSRDQKEVRKIEDERKEMDRILEKISREGIGSLNSAEKKFLDRTSQKLRNRS